MYLECACLGASGVSHPCLILVGVASCCSVMQAANQSCKDRHPDKAPGDVRFMACYAFSDVWACMHSQHDASCQAVMRLVATGVQLLEGFWWCNGYRQRQHHHSAFEMCSCCHWSCNLSDSVPFLVTCRLSQHDASCQAVLQLVALNLKSP